MRQRRCLSVRVHNERRNTMVVFDSIRKRQAFECNNNNIIDPPHRVNIGVCIVRPPTIRTARGETHHHHQRHRHRDDLFCMRSAFVCWTLRIVELSLRSE